ncbi:MAG: GldG family protein [Planctomycetota bacterium]
MSGSTRARSVGRLSRLGIGAQVIASIALALAAVLLINWLAARPGIRKRVDLTAASSNTLSTAAQSVLENLEDDVRIDLLYQPEEQPITQLAGDVWVRVQKLLVLMEAAAGGRVEVEAVDTSDVEAWKIRQQELQLRGFENGLVVSRGDRRKFLSLVGDLALIDLGNPVPNQYVPPRVVQFSAEQAIIEAVLDVTSGETLHAYFTFGYGEPDPLENDGQNDMGLLGELIEKDGFRVHRWNRLEDGPLPDDCAVLVAVAPEAGWPEAMYGDIVDYVERGGRLIVAPNTLPDLMLRSDIPDLLEHFGLEVSEGRVMVLARDRQTGRVVEGVAQNELHFVRPTQMSTHPMLSLLKREGATVIIPFAHQVRVIEQPPDGVAQHLFQSAPESWIDAPPCDRRYDAATEGVFGAFPLGATVQREPMQEVDAPVGLEVIPKIRIVALGSQTVFGNHAVADGSLRVPDLMRAVFNWVVDREHRIAVPPRDPDLRFLPPGEPEGFVFVTRVAQFYLPLAALAAGLFVWFRRVRGSRRRTSPVEPEPRVQEDAA